MKLLIGLGNPGPKYSKTRHNVGFAALDHFAGTLDETFAHKKNLEAEIIKTGEVVLAKPQTFMNNSGVAVQKIADYFKIAPEGICVLYDDIDLPFGDIRTRTEGSAGTHNGMRSIVQHLGTEFPRIRIGISSEDQGRIPIEDFVLQNFSESEQKTLEEKILPHVSILLEDLAEGKQLDNTSQSIL